MIASLLLILTSFNLFGEAFLSAGGDHCHLQKNISKTGTISLKIPSGGFLKSSKSNQQDSHCKDFCDLGACHLNHCASILFEDFNFFGFSFPFKNELIINQFFDIDSPYLEGLKRPPRIS